MKCSKNRIDSWKYSDIFLSRDFWSSNVFYLSPLDVYEKLIDEYKLVCAKVQKWFRWKFGTDDKVSSVIEMVFVVCLRQLGKKKNDWLTLHAWYQDEMVLWDHCTPTLQYFRHLKAMGVMDQDNCHDEWCDWKMEMEKQHQSLYFQRVYLYFVSFVCCQHSNFTPFLPAVKVVTANTFIGWCVFRYSTFTTFTILQFQMSP